MGSSGEKSGATIRVLVADDHDIVRFGLRKMLEAEPGIEVVGEASSGVEALELCRSLKPDIVVMDIRLPGVDGITATRLIKREFPNTAVLILTAYESTEYLVESVRAGAAGYLLKEKAVQRLPGAVRRVMNGESPLDQELAMRVLKGISEKRGAHSPDGDEVVRTGFLLEKLTDREREILTLVAMGLSNQEIAERLYLSVGTVKSHVHRIISKLGVSDRTQAAVLAVQLGMVST
ncbi:response regulator transcription factor [Rubrobacter calidifluminis]|uniref:response regulator transcription factor n=1 Tax=Rubrobacter calidifluminis TaxID=1392640 RepID=UPI0023624866|nr:response regulator transcription factor [Rubrobacter calidifluminis]